MRVLLPLVLGGCVASADVLTDVGTPCVDGDLLEVTAFVDDLRTCDLLLGFTCAMTVEGRTLAVRTDAVLRRGTSGCEPEPSAIATRCTLPEDLDVDRITLGEIEVAWADAACE